MASNDFNLRCKTAEGTFTISDLNAESTVADLKLCLEKLTKVKPEVMKILVGYPPKPFTSENDNVKLHEVDVRAGDTIILECQVPTRKIKAEEVLVKEEIKVIQKCISKGSTPRLRKNDFVKRPCKENFVASEEVQIMDQIPSSCMKEEGRPSILPSSDVIVVDEGPTVSSSSSGTQSNESIPVVDLVSNVTNHEEFVSDGIMMRHVVPSNNSCLFTSLDFILSNGEAESAPSDEMRKIIANVVSSNPIKYNAAYLSMSNRAYCDWILNTSHWGGAIELSILSEFFKLEIVAVDTKSLAMHHFGESHNFRRRVFMIYDGIHYDPLVLELGMDRQTVFPADDPRPMDMALELAREAKSSRQFTDVANFVVQCQTCGTRLCGDIEARTHAMNTGHCNFGEL